MEKMILRQLGNVMKFGDFCKSVNERMEVSISANDVLSLLGRRDVLDEKDEE